MDVRSYGYVVIQTAKLDEWRDFATNVLGMMIAPGMPDDGNLYLKMDERPFRFMIVEGDSEVLLASGFELADKACLDATCAKLDAAGIGYVAGSDDEAAAKKVLGLIKLKDPAGNGLELYYGADLDYLKFVSPTGIDEFETGFNGDMGFGHAVFPAPNLEETHAFYTDVLGFGDTDYMHFKFSEDPNDPGMGLNFMHVNNPRHHSVALYQAPDPSGCIHLMLEVKSVDEVGYCLDRVLEKEIKVTSTLGRHTNDRMLSFYMQTPSGFALEFGTGGLQVDWEGYTPTKSTLPSYWGHKFEM